ncbi:MAG: alanine dehydrogenase [Deltaproteobacteria bacterium]|nr:alanine dehydrogenase [Deltaproteobacteria bacterium]
MIIGIPKEIKDNEFRVALVPEGAGKLTKAGHTVLIEKNAGIGSGISDEEFMAKGAKIVATAKEVFSSSELIVKVKEPIKEEFQLLCKGQMLFTFLHLAAKRELANILLEKKITAIGYETVEVEANGKTLTPILSPMSEVAGKLATQFGAEFLLKSNGGQGILLSGVNGKMRGFVVIIGAGIVGINAAKIALGLGARVVILDINKENLDAAEKELPELKTLLSTEENIEQNVIKADLLIGAVHIPGARTPIIVKKKLVEKMKKGSVILDVAVDQGGCIETIRPTTHSDPTYLVSGVIHYGVTNMPGAVPRSSTFALTDITLPYVLTLAKSASVSKAIDNKEELKKGINTYLGNLTNKATSKALDLPFTALDTLL